MSLARRPRRIQATMNVVPYIDVMLVLLVIFMVAAPMLQPGSVNLPSMGRVDTAMDSVPLIVEVSATGQYLLRDDSQQRQTKMPNVEALIAAVQAVQPARPVLIAGDRSVRYDAVLNVMDVLQTAGIARVGLLVTPTAGS